jgi:hypothetical protein
MSLGCGFRLLPSITPSQNLKLILDRHKREPRAEYALGACESLLPQACRLFCLGGDFRWGVVARMGLLIKT